MDAFERYKATLLEGFNRETLKFDAVLRDLLVDPDSTSLQNELDALRQYPERLRELEEKHKRLMEKHLKLVAKSREMKRTLKSWQAYHDKIKSRSQRRSQVCEDVVTAQANSVPKAIERPPPSHNKSLMGRLELSQDSTQAPSSPVVTNTILTTSSASIDTNGPEQDSDEPVLVSERSLKRKRVTIRSGSLSELIVVKCEQGSSPVSSACTPSKRFINDTLDLDEIGVSKKQQLRSVLGSGNPRLSVVEVSAPEKYTHAIATGKVPSHDAKNLDDADGPHHNTNAYFAELGRQHAKKLRKMQGNLDFLAPKHIQGSGNPRLAQQYIHNSKVNVMQYPLDDHAVDSSDPSIDILQPITHNVQLPPKLNRNGFLSEKSATTRQRGGVSAHISLLSEDGENADHESERHSGLAVDLTSKIMAPAEVHHRLQEMLTGPSLEKPLLAVNAKYRLKTSFASSSTTTLPQQVNVAKFTPDRRPLRALPVHGLHLEDFKINPAANHGIGFAFTEACRDKKQRGTPTNCMKSDCCGNKPREVAKIGGIFPMQSQSLSDEPSRTEWEEDLGLLRDPVEFAAENVFKMSGPEKSAALLTAGSKRLGQDNGKHIHIQERARSPPGFWRTGMPSTQEAEADKQEAVALERAEVDRRYAEAMKTYGRWMFRDE